jgi:hypothetical protein
VKAVLCHGSAAFTVFASRKFNLEFQTHIFEISFMTLLLPSFPPI